MKDKDIYLKIIYDSILKINSYIGEMNFDDFSSDNKSFDATLTQLMHIGEITRKLVDNFGEISELPTKEMISMRNFIAHDYLGISEKIIYDTIIYDLPEIQKIIKNMI